jgi:hypothetical protein
MTPRARFWTLAGLLAVTVAFGVVGALRTARVTLSGQYGYVPDPDGTREFLNELTQPTFAEAGRDSMAQAKGVDTFLYRFTDKAHREVYGEPWQCWDQGDVGTCVSMAFGLGCQTAMAVDWDVSSGKGAQPPPAVASEPIYGGSRTSGRMPPISFNGGGDGSYGGAAARWISGQCKVEGIGGVLFREKYPEADLTSYSKTLSRDWGRSGVPQPLAIKAHEVRMMAVAQINTWAEFCASIERGSPVVLCSTVGYGRWDGSNPQRDSQGFLPRGKSWAHAMLAWGVRHAKPGDPSSRDGGLIQNSWSKRWCGGPKWPADQPDGSFWASRADIEAALAQGDSFAIGKANFKWRQLDNRVWFDKERR